MIIHSCCLDIIQKRLNIQGELDGISGGTRSQVVLPCLQALGPGIEVRRGQLIVRGLCHVDVQALRLADEGSSCASQVDQGFLRDLPNILVEVFQVLWDRLDFLDTAIVSNQLVPHIIIP